MAAHSATLSYLPTTTHALVTIPAYNEATRIEASIGSVLAELSSSGLRYTLSVAEDGSFDGTQSVLQRIQERTPALLVHHEQIRRGRGWALRNLWSSVEADVYAFCDADLSSSPATLIEAIRRVEAGAEVVTASRYLDDSATRRPPLRYLVSRAYNKLTQLLFDDGIEDHQCGLKAFSRRAIRALLPRTKADSWFWDTEILVLATRLGFHVDELPATWTEKKARRTSITRLASDVVLHGGGLVKLKGELDGAGRPAWSSSGPPSSQAIENS